MWLRQQQDRPTTCPNARALAAPRRSGKIARDYLTYFTLSPKQVRYRALQAYHSKFDPGGDTFHARNAGVELTDKHFNSAPTPTENTSRHCHPAPHYPAFCAPTFAGAGIADSGVGNLRKPAFDATQPRQFIQSLYQLLRCQTRQDFFNETAGRVVRALLGLQPLTTTSSPLRLPPVKPCLRFRRVRHMVRAATPSGYAPLRTRHNEALQKRCCLNPDELERWKAAIVGGSNAVAIDG